MATRKDRSDEALKTLKWPAWGKRRKAIAAAFAAKIQYGKGPTVLEELIPGKANVDEDDTEEDEEEDAEGGDKGRRPQQMPADEFGKQRLSYYGYLENKYADQIETVEDGTVHQGVTQWMLEWKTKAWYRRPGKAQKIDN
eukprot:gene17905-biopygen29851